MSRHQWSTRQKFAAVGVGVAAMVFSGCQSVGPRLGPNAAVGSAVAGATGGLIGAAIGAADGNAGEGALIGSLAGVATGGVVGHAIDQENAANRERWQQGQRQAQAQAVTFAQIVQMTQSGLSDEVIENQLAAYGAERVPSANDLIQLKSSGVSDRVIGHLQTGHLPRLQNGPPVFAAGVGAPVYVTDPRIIVPVRPGPACSPVPRRHWHPRRAGIRINF